MGDPRKANDASDAVSRRISPAERALAALDRQKSCSRKWTTQEDDLLKSLVETHGTEGQWGVIALFMGTRTARQCRERWLYKLDPGVVKTPFSVEESVLFEQLVATYGSAWSTIAAKMPGRCANDLRNRYHSAKRSESRTEARASKAAKRLKRWRQEEKDDVAQEDAAFCEQRSPRPAIPSIPAETELEAVGHITATAPETLRAPLPHVSASNTAVMNWSQTSAPVAPADWLNVSSFSPGVLVGLGATPLCADPESTLTPAGWPLSYSDLDNVPLPQPGPIPRFLTKSPSGLAPTAIWSSPHGSARYERASGPSYCPVMPPPPTAPSARSHGGSGTPKSPATWFANLVRPFVSGLAASEDVSLVFRSDPSRPQPGIASQTQSQMRIMPSGARFPPPSS